MIGKRRGGKKQRVEVAVRSAPRPWISERLLMLGWLLQGREVLRRERAAMRSDDVLFFEAWGGWARFSLSSALLFLGVAVVLAFGFDIDVPLFIALSFSALVCLIVSSIVFCVSWALSVFDATLWHDVAILVIAVGVLLVLGIPQSVLSEPLWSY